MPFFCIRISQGSVATCLKRGGIFKHVFIANLLPSRLVKKFWKSDNSEVMAKSLVSCFFDSRCIERIRPRPRRIGLYVRQIDHRPMIMHFNCSWFAVFGSDSNSVRRIWVCQSVFSCTVLFVSISQVIGCEDRLRNDLYCVEWGVKLYSNSKLGGSMPCCRLRRRKFWKFEYEMVHSEVYLNNVVSIAPFSIPTPFRKLLFFCMFSLFNFSSIFPYSWPHLPLCAGVHVGCWTIP